MISVKNVIIFEWDMKGKLEFCTISSQKNQEEEGAKLLWNLINSAKTHFSTKNKPSFFKWYLYDLFIYLITQEYVKQIINGFWYEKDNIYLNNMLLYACENE